MTRACLRMATTCILFTTAATARAGEVPERLPPPTPVPLPAHAPVPHYDLTIALDVAGHHADVREVVTWTNPCRRPATDVVFNAHSHYALPDKDVGFMAKMLEILRMDPGEALDLDGPACEVKRVSLLVPQANGAREVEIPFEWPADNLTALTARLPGPVAQGETVAIAVDFSMRLPQKQGRWGQWKDVTFLSNWQPVLAVYDDGGWHPTPYIPWHQPFFNEAGGFHARVTLPCDQRVACTGSIVASRDLGRGLREVEIAVSCARDFAFLCCPRYCEHVDLAGPVRVRVMALPEHEYYAREMLKFACQAIETYSRWFGPYPYPEFTIAESYFGWNGNECAGLVMIDERIFAMPHVAGGFVEYLVSHEVCHQWWYNVVGTNGYCETWMDEGLATYFGHRLMTCKYGKDNPMLKLPEGLGWLPNIYRETYRFYGLYGTLGRGEAGPTVQDMPKYEHVVNLFSMCYDRGSKVVGMIEDRLGEPAFFDFMRGVYARYHFRILRVADFQRELETYTGRSWDEFFRHWVYGGDMTDWSVEHVDVVDLPPEGCAKPRKGGPCKVTVMLRQKAEYSEQTVVGFAFDGSENYQVRVPIVPGASSLTLNDPPARVETLPDNRMRVEVCLPCRPTQVAVDPDQLLVDPEPADNYWKKRCRFRVTPLYTLLDETDLTTAYDRWNITAGPWLYAEAYADPWFERSPIAGFRVGGYRTQSCNAGVFLGYRTDYQDLAVGGDILIDHWPWAHTQVGITAERSLSSENDDASDRAVLFGRYVFQYGDSLYLPPMHFVEAFGAVVENALPNPRHQPVQGVPFDHVTTVGVHYHLDYLTPYWSPEGGFRFDATYGAGLPTLTEDQSFNRVDAQFSYVKSLPDGLGWLSETRLAARAYGGVGVPTDGYLFALGGSERFRGFSLGEREGSAVWVGSLEWRFPIIHGHECDCVDRCIRLRGVNGAAFYDVGDVYLRGHEVSPVAHAVGAGLRLDVVWFSFVERSTIRFDVAKAVNYNTPTQFWLAFQVPF